MERGRERGREWERERWRGSELMRGSGSPWWEVESRRVGESDDEGEGW